MDKYRMAVLASHPIQYHAPLFRALNANSKIDLTVYFCWDSTGKFDPEFGLHIAWDVPLMDEYRYRFLPNLSLKPGSSFLGQINPSILKQLSHTQFDAILLQGYTTVTVWLALIGAWVTHTPILFRGETDLLRPRKRWKEILKRWMLPRLFRRIDAFLFSYTANAEYYRRYGVSESKLFFCPCAVDNAFWQEQAEKFKPRKSELKKKYGIAPDLPVILFVGKLTTIKRPFDVLRAFNGIGKICKASLVFVGDGLLRPDLEREVQEEGIPRVYFAGFKNQTELGPFYAMADVFVLPSDYDLSPKALNEAMNFGLPVVVSDRVGTAQDLVQPGENGFITPVGDVETLQNYLSKILKNPELKEKMGQRSLEIVSRWNVDEDVRGILAALEFVHKNRTRRS